MMQHARLQFTPLEAQIACLVLVAAGDGKPDAHEHALIHKIITETQRASAEQMTTTIALTLDLLTAEGNPATVLELIGRALIQNDTQNNTPNNTPNNTLPTAITQATQAYALAADFVIRNNRITAEEMRILDQLAEHLHIDRLTRAAIDLASRARFARF